MRPTTPKAGGWIAGTVFLSLLILAAGWFFAVSPLLNQAGQTREQTDAQLSQNSITQGKISKLKNQYENREQLALDLAALREQIPTTYDMATYRREIAAAAQARGVTIVSITVGVAQSVMPVAPVTAPTEDQTAADPTAGGEAAPADGAAAPVPAAPEVTGPYGLPVSIDVLGRYDAVVAFLSDVQSATKRLMVVEQLTGTAPAPAEASGGKPAIGPGDLELIITGSVFVLPDKASAADAPADGDTPAEPTPLPPANGRNPLVTNG